ncbi:MAG TPA: hypothetical protein VN788_03640 [Verrucomicrobiae bacterium]|nr:hypothetical protein [Verrucomicrobiae bacterium]
MYPSVQAQFRAFNEPFEGSIPYMYLDVKGLVTVGVGNLIDPVALATALAFTFKNKPGIATPGAAATPDQIAAEWQKLKSNTSLAQRGHLACAPITDLELADGPLNDLILKRLTQNESFLKRQAPFAQFDTWPADAQLGLLSMAWAMGPAAPLNFHHFCAACQNLDFKTAAAQCEMSTAGNPGVIPRNNANQKLFQNAAAVLAGSADSGLQSATLYYPQALASG